MKNQIQTAIENPADICECGDYRRDHPNNGPCKLNELGHGLPSDVYKGCFKFRLAPSSPPLLPTKHYIRTGIEPHDIQTAVELRDRATQMALNFVGQSISSSDGSYELLIDIVCDALEEARSEAISVAAEDERDECLKILQRAYQEWFDGDYSPSEAFESAKDRIRARGNDDTKR